MSDLIIVALIWCATILLTVGGVFVAGTWLNVGGANILKRKMNDHYSKQLEEAKRAKLVSKP